jgi:hypothetical protein
MSPIEVQPLGVKRPGSEPRGSKFAGAEWVAQQAATSRWCSASRDAARGMSCAIGTLLLEPAGVMGAARSPTPG